MLMQHGDGVAARLRGLAMARRHKSTTGTVVKQGMARAHHVDEAHAPHDDHGAASATGEASHAGMLPHGSRHRRQYDEGQDSTNFGALGRHGTERAGLQRSGAPGIEHEEVSGRLFDTLRLLQERSTERVATLKTRRQGDALRTLRKLRELENPRLREPSRAALYVNGMPLNPAGKEQSGEEGVSTAATTAAAAHGIHHDSSRWREPLATSSPYMQDTVWGEAKALAAAANGNKKLYSNYERQLEMEQEVHDRAIASYEDMVHDLKEAGKISEVRCVLCL